jgi:hypothetical protein
MPNHDDDRLVTALRTAALDHIDDHIVQLIPVPPEPRSWLLSLFEDDEGWCSGWAERVVALALVERRWYACPVAALPVGRRAQQPRLRQTERAIQAVAYDPNSPEGFTTRRDRESWTDVLVEP